MLVSFEERDRLRREARQLIWARLYPIGPRFREITEEAAEKITDHILNYMETRHNGTKYTGHSATETK